MILNKHQILIAEDLNYKIVTIPKWGGDVRLKSFTLKEQKQFEELREADKPNDEVVLEVLLIACVDENCAPLFSREDLQLLQKKNAQVLIDLFTHAMELNSISQEELELKAKN